MGNLLKVHSLAALFSHPARIALTVALFLLNWRSTLQRRKPEPRRARGSKQPLGLIAFGDRAGRVAPLSSRSCIIDGEAVICRPDGDASFVLLRLSAAETVTVGLGAT
jgi:hypothetical protein